MMTTIVSPAATPTFGEHRMMLRPRDDDDQKVRESELEITPEASQLTWTQDVFGNHVTTARFADRASELRFKSTIRVDHAPAGFRAADIEDFARTHPFAYAAEHHAAVPAPHARSGPRIGCRVVEERSFFTALFLADIWQGSARAGRRGFR